MKKLMMVIGGSAMLLAACGDESEEAGDTMDPAEGEGLYEENCLSCHGDDMDGGTGPALDGYSADEVVTAIEEGPGTMPADLVEGEEAESVAAYVEEEAG
ncbi:mono/diheme cytochrome c family protein [Geomicrobium halophilum]|uniref:Mono/diheme cytochrome c family protein n=1 Tax=Geomicrobium halophilum TaxID=549000 RepID=A0A841PR03_9BACL|nr:cytochrome c [Geomicrobium halophilum]MBB6451220.1 mono/diheme cytochrome c family protein [Geomicrobium halophilum]